MPAVYFHQRDRGYLTPQPDYFHKQVHQLPGLTRHLTEFQMLLNTSASRSTLIGADFFPTLTEVMAIQSTAGHNLFPELRSLVWSCEREADFVGCEAIIQASPRLKAFACEESRKEAPERTWPTLFRTLASVQSLEILELQARNLGPIGPGSRTGLALSYLLSKPNIRQLLLPDQVVTSTLVMISLASARQLEKLTLVESTPSIADGSAVHCTVSSDRLSHLSGTPQSLRSILAGESGLKALTKLSIIYPWISFTWSFVRQFVDLIEKGCPILETLELEGRIDDAANLETHGIRAGFAIAGLGACTRMRRFHMDIKSNGWSTSPVPRDFNPSDSDWRCLTSQWPELQEMWYDLGRESLNDEEYKPALDPAPRATINTLTAFSRSCRQLKSLAVPMSATIHDTRAALQDDILPFSDSMDRMYFFRASIEDDAVEELAMLLLRLTRDDVELYPTELDDPDSTEGDELDSSREMNWHAAKKLVHFTRRARPLGAQASAS
ncbi:hypothetical protein FRC05_008975 [Tulasnella sp. 425]|nr:hypothetical protein FRC05_008975 [Tulasnella sp. 425]